MGNDRDEMKALKSLLEAFSQLTMKELMKEHILGLLELIT
jgi:hypothetical protein